MRSVWSRLGAGSTISVVPSAWRPARTSAVFTCPLGTASSARTPASEPPRIDSGASRPPSRPSIVAPIRRSGSTTRPIGRALERRVAGRGPSGTDGRRAGRRASASSCPSSRSRARSAGSVSASRPAPSTDDLAGALGAHRNPEVRERGHGSGGRRRRPRARAAGWCRPRAPRTAGPGARCPCSPGRGAGRAGAADRR